MAGLAGVVSQRRAVKLKSVKGETNGGSSEESNGEEGSISNHHNSTYLNFDDEIDARWRFTTDHSSMVCQGQEDDAR